MALTRQRGNAGAGPRDAGASTRHSHAGAWEREFFSLSLKF